MSISVLVATFGDPEWMLIGRRAAESASDQGAHEVISKYNRDGTVTSSRNAAAELATGTHLLFVDADDEIAPGFVGAMERSIEQDGANGKRLLLTPAIARPNPRTGRGRGNRGIFLPEQPLSDKNWLVIGTLIQRDFFWEIGGFDEADPHGLDDYGLWTRAAAAGARVVKVPDAVYIAHTRRNNSHSEFYRRDPDNYMREYHRIRRSAWPELYDDAA